MNEKAKLTTGGAQGGPHQGGKGRRPGQAGPGKPLGKQMLNKLGGLKHRAGMGMMAGAGRPGGQGQRANQPAPGQGQVAAQPAGEARDATLLPAAPAPEDQPAARPDKPKQKGVEPPLKVIEVRPLAEPATLKPRHKGLLISLAAVVVVPFLLTAIYLYGVSLDRFGSTAGFTVRSEETSSASDLLGGLASFAGQGGGSDGQVLYEFIQSQEIVEEINARHDLVKIYSQHWSSDPVFSIWPDASIEDLLWYWQRIVRISFDQASGMIEIRVLAYDPKTAQMIAQDIVDASQKKINDLNAAARADTMRYAQEDLDAAVTRLNEARSALTEFRTRTQIADPSADLQGQMGVINNLQQQLAEALVERDLLREAASGSTDPRVRQMQDRIDAIRARIAQERETFAKEKIPGVDADYPTLMSEYEGLTVNREFAETTYRAALTALDAARANASRQSRYLAEYIRPTLPQTAEFPQRGVILGLTLLFLSLFWGIMALIYYSLRDRR